MKKAITVLLVGLFFIVSLKTPVQANQCKQSMPSINTISVSPMFTNILLFQNSFNISTSGTANVYSFLNAQSCDQLIIVANLQQLDSGTWTTIKTWTTISYGTSATLSGSYFVPNAKFYRVVTTGTVYRAGMQIEQNMNTSDTKYY